LAQRRPELLKENGVGRRSSESVLNGGRSASPLLQHPHHICNSSAAKPPSFSRRQSDYLAEGRRGSYCEPTHSSLAKREGSLPRRGSGAGFERRGSTAYSGGYDSLPRRSSAASGGGDSYARSRAVERRPSSLTRRNSEDVDAAEMQRRRLSEAGLRRPSATDLVLNDNTDQLMVGQEVWVDGTKKGRIAYLGTVHFAKVRIPQFTVHCKFISIHFCLKNLIVVVKY
jgi:hypothetical protein